MSDDPHDIPLEQVLSAAAEQVVDGINTSMPGQIVEYDKTTQRATVQPLIKKSHVQEDDTELVEPLPLVHDVIVLHPGPARGRITFPVKVGDTCVLIFSSCSLAAWRTSKGGMVDPKDTRRHDISDAIAIVGLHAFGNVPTDAPDDALVLHVGDGVTAKIGGSSGTQKTLMADNFLSALDNLFTAIKTAVGTITGGTAAAAAILTAIEAFQLAALRNAYKTDKTEVK